MVGLKIDRIFHGISCKTISSVASGQVQENRLKSSLISDYLEYLTASAFWLFFLGARLRQFRNDPSRLDYRRKVAIP
jgi:hypothetical protein